MSNRKCIVCGKDVRDGDETEHLRTNHLGPHYFWLDARKYRTEEPSLTGGAIKALGGSSAWYQLYQEQDGGDIAIGDGVAVSVVGEPHFWCAPPATMLG